MSEEYVAPVRKRGRPPKALQQQVQETQPVVQNAEESAVITAPETEKPKKKGKKSWKPANLLDFEGKDPNYTYRVVRNDQRNIAKKEKEGWEYVDGLTGDGVNHVPDNRIEKGRSLTSNVQGPDWILMRMDNETAEARREYFQKKTDARSAGIVNKLRGDLQGGGLTTPISGSVTISQGGRTEVIK